MSSLKSLDALFVTAIVEDDPVEFTWNGSTYRGTCTQRTTSKDLDSGGFLADFESAILIPISAFSSSFPSEQNKVEMYCTPEGIPCVQTETGAVLQPHRIMRVGRAGGALHLFLISAVK